MERVRTNPSQLRARDVPTLDTNNGLIARAPELWLALAFSGAMLAGAYAFQFIGGLAPCQMCYWQRWAHWLVVGVALLGLFLPNRRFWGVMAASGLLASVIIAGYHAGVEYAWWEGPKTCTAGVPDLDAIRAGGDIFRNLGEAEFVDCSKPAWSMLGISMAGWNALLSLGALAMVILGMKRSR